MSGSSQGLRHGTLNFVEIFVDIFQDREVKFMRMIQNELLARQGKIEKILWHKLNDAIKFLGLEKLITKLEDLSMLYAANYSLYTLDLMMEIVHLKSSKEIINECSKSSAVSFYSCFEILVVVVIVSINLPNVSTLIIEKNWGLWMKLVGKVILVNFEFWRQMVDRGNFGSNMDLSRITVCRLYDSCVRCIGAKCTWFESLDGGWGCSLNLSTIKKTVLHILRPSDDCEVLLSTTSMPPTASTDYIPFVIVIIAVLVLGTCIYHAYRACQRERGQQDQISSQQNQISSQQNQISSQSNQISPQQNQISPQTNHVSIPMEMESMEVFTSTSRPNTRSMTQNGRSKRVKLSGLKRTRK